MRPSAYRKAVIATKPILYMPGALGASAAAPTPRDVVAGRDGNAFFGVSGRNRFISDSSAMQFTTSGYNFEIPNNSAWSNIKSIGCWSVTPAAGSYQCMIDRDVGSGSAQRHFQFRKNNADQFEFIPFNASGVPTAILSGGPTIADNKWHFLIATWGTDAVARIFVDGIYANSASAASFANPSTTINIRVGYSQSGAGVFQFFGSMAHIMFHDRELKSTEIAKLYRLIR